MTEKVLKLPFRPRARLLQLLGDQLIGSHRLAVFELVKNAYDADASKVTITFKGLNTVEPSIVVEDDGDGMSLDIIRDIWLVPAHDHRELQRKALRRTRAGRLPLGEKGLGRFAVHKLGDCIELVSRAESQPECVVNIDWNQLVEKPLLQDAEVTIGSRSPEVFIGEQTGTRVIITQLRQKDWGRGEIRRLFRQITSIASPFVKREDQFITELRIPDHPEWVDGIPDIKTLLERAPWRFDFTFEGGCFSWSYTFRGIPGIQLEPRNADEDDAKLLIPPLRDTDSSDTFQTKRNITKKSVADAEYAKGIGPICGTLFAFDRDKEVVSRLGDGQLLRKFLDENGGVRVYRDGMRVYDYGEQHDDWLGLDLRRVNTPVRNLSRNIIVGAIDLTLEHSSQLQEKTSREGFMENDALTRLRSLVLGALSKFEVERKLDKDHIRELTDRKHATEIQKIEKPLEQLRKIAKKHKLSEELEPTILKIERNYHDMRETVLRAGLPGMGLAIVFHEIEQGVKILHKAIESGEKIETIKIQSKELIRLLGGFSKLLRQHDRKTNGLKRLIQQSRDINRIRFRKHNVILTCPFLEEDKHDVKQNFAFGLLLGALNNILDNAFYWLQVRWPEEEARQRKIYLDVQHDFSEGPAIIIADNGPGLQDEPEYLTRPFFSRRPEGMGVGLYYTNMVMELNQGRLLFPNAAEADVPEEFDGAVLALVFNNGDGQ